MKLIYNLGILFYSALVRILSPFNNKARLWVKGRKDWYEKLNQKILQGEKYIWIHCASLGEFEQGRPIIEAIKERRPDFRIVLTFFSPSGFEIRKNYQLADVISYLPSDTYQNAEKLVDLIRPYLVIFVKYEFWNNFISALKARKIPLYLVSGVFHPEQPFFKWYGSFFRKILDNFSWIFVQDDHSVELLRRIGIKNVSVAGDTRFDRVMQITDKAKDIPPLQSFRGNERLFLAGSSWKQDEEIICRYINRFPGRMKWVFAPHEVDNKNIERLEKLIETRHVRYSLYSDNSADARVMIIDNIGMLSSAYRYAYIAAIGGGFGKGIHNILEPACWSIPVLFGPNHQKFREAEGLINNGGSISFDSYDSFRDILDMLLDDESVYSRAAKAAGNYVRENTGATTKILDELIGKDINRSY